MINTILIISLAFNVILIGVLVQTMRDYKSLLKHIHRVKDVAPKSDTSRAAVLKLQNELSKYVGTDTEGNVIIDVLDPNVFTETEEV